MFRDLSDEKNPTPKYQTPLVWDLNTIQKQEEGKREQNGENQNLL